MYRRKAACAVESGVCAQTRHSGDGGEAYYRELRRCNSFAFTLSRHVWLTTCGSRIGRGSNRRLMQVQCGVFRHTSFVPSRCPRFRRGSWYCSITTVVHESCSHHCMPDLPVGGQYCLSNSERGLLSHHVTQSSAIPTVEPDVIYRPESVMAKAGVSYELERYLFQRRRIAFSIATSCSSQLRCHRCSSTAPPPSFTARMMR